MIRWIERPRQSLSKISEGFQETFLDFWCLAVNPLPQKSIFNVCCKQGTP